MSAANLEVTVSSVNLLENVILAERTVTKQRIALRTQRTQPRFLHGTRGRDLNNRTQKMKKQDLRDTILKLSSWPMTA